MAKSADGVHAPHALLHHYYRSDADRRRFIRGIFDDTAGDYDRVDRLLALGTGSWYRRQALLRAGLSPGMRVLDVATGTGLVAREIQRVLAGTGSLVGLDPSPGMMGASGRPLRVSRVQGRAEFLPFADGSFDFLSLGFALRHLDDLLGVFREFRRVLGPGGRVLLLEITRPEGRWSGAMMRWYMRRLVPLASRLVARHRDTPRLYEYYWDTIEACAPPARVLATLSAAGFTQPDRHVELGMFSEFRASV
jgi:demethylmenaquinone methyltransferase / 2-methoxy-6-polyprenyl-1,4-benzoquinol methylase